MGTRRTSTGETEMRETVAAHGATVFSLAVRLTGDRAAAEEIAQDVFLELWRTQLPFASAAHQRFWLRRVAVHRSTDYLRRRARRPTLVSDDGWLEGEPATAEERQLPCELTTQLDTLLLSLPSPLRAALVLRYGEDELSPEQIGALLGQPPATVKSNLRRGLAMLRRKAGITLKEFVRHA